MCGDACKEHFSFMFESVLLLSGIYSRSCTGTQAMNVSPSSLAWEAFQKVTHCTLGGIRGKQGFNGEELDVSQGCHLV